jgi:hypothetical protein
MRTILFYILLSIYGSLPVFANGSPIRTNFVFKTANPQPIEVKDIKILKENLDIKIHEDYSIVSVEYTMKNDGPELSFDYGFPVDYFMKSYTPGLLPELDWNISNIKEFSIHDENRQLEIVEKFDTTIYKDVLKSKIIFYDKVDVARCWFTTKLHFSANQEKRITVRYTIANTVFDMLMSDMYFIMYSDRVLTYDFSPAAYFGNSTIGEMNMRIDVSELKTCNCKYYIEFGSKLDNKNGILTFSKKNFDLKTAEKLFVVYRMDNVYKTSVPDKYRFGSNWFRYVKPESKGIVDARTLLFDGDPATPWLGNKGKGDWLEVAFGKDSVSYIGFINGNTADSQAYYDYPRIKKLKLELYSKTFRGYMGVNHLVLELEDKDYNHFSKKYFGGFITTLFDLGTDFYDDIKKIKITVLDVYPGRKYKNTAIGELYVYKFRDLQPKFKESETGF